MRVLFVVPDLKRASGISVFAIETAKALGRLGMEVGVAVVCDDVVSRYPTEGLRVFKADSILPQIEQREWDVIHIHGLWTPFFHRVCRMARRSKTPYLISPHGMLTPWALRNKMLKKFIGLLAYQWMDLRQANWLHATAASEIADFRRIGLCNKTLVAPLGVSLPDLTSQDLAEPRNKTLLFVSRVQRKKGLSNLVEAWAQVKKSSPKLVDDWRIRVVGPDEDGHVAELTALCRRLGVDDAFEFVGPKFGADLKAEYVAADLFVLPTHSENFGSVVIEALAHEVTVITTKGAPWAELEERRCGWWIDIGVDPLVKVLKEAMALSDEERRAMGMRGRELVREKYSWSAVAKQMKLRLESIVRESRYEKSVIVID